MLPTKFRVSWPFGSGEEGKNRLSRLQPWWPSWISNRNNFSYFFIYKSSWCFLPSFESIGLLVQEKKSKIDFQDGRHGGHLGFWIRTVLAIFYLHVTPMLPTKFWVNWPFGSGEEAKNRFSWGPSWISNQNDFSYFWDTSHPDASYEVSESTGFLVQEKKRKIDFQDGHHGSHFGFPIRRILAIYLQDTLMLPTKFRVNWPFGSGEEAKNGFSRWPPWSTSHPDAYKFQVHWPRGVGGVGF